MTDLFADWPSESLKQVTITRPDSNPADQTVESLYLDLAGTRSPLRLAGQLRQLLGFVRKTEPDVIYFRTAGWPLVLELSVLLLSRYPMVTHIMDDWPEARRRSGRRFSRALDLLLRRVMVRSKARLAISEPMARAFAERYGVPFQVVHAGTDRTPPVPPAVVRASSQGDDKVIFYSGSIAPDQTASSLVVLADAVKLLRHKGVKAQLQVAPSSEMPVSLRTSLESAEAVILDQTSPADYLDRLAVADIVVATANFDPESIAFLRYSMPNKIPDLLASGTPTLIFAPAELAYVQLAAESGWACVVDTNDPQVLASAIGDLVHNDIAGKELVTAASNACTTTFAWPVLRQRFEQTLRIAPG